MERQPKEVDENHGDHRVGEKLVEILDPLHAATHEQPCRDDPGQKHKHGQGCGARSRIVAHRPAGSADQRILQIPEDFSRTICEGLEPGISRPDKAPDDSE